MYEEHYAVIYRFVSLRLADSAARSDVVAEVFATAWRRRADLPRPPADRPWLFGVAKKTLATHRRGEARRLRLVARVAAEPPATDRTSEAPTATLVLQPSTPGRRVPSRVARPPPSIGS
jgi:DNA-directed RNA polymerase specialized sigma24 family protein